MSRLYPRNSKNGREFKWREAFMQITVSGFAGVLSMLFCWYINAPLPLLSGIFGRNVRVYLDSSWRR